MNTYKSNTIKSTCEYYSSFKLSLPAVLRSLLQSHCEMVHTVEDGCAHTASLMAKLNHQRKQAQFCDCVIRKTQGQIYPVHRCILAASSPVLASILYSSGVLVELDAPCLSDCILGHLLDYIYTGTLPHLDYQLYLHLLSAAQYLKLDELQHTIRTKVTDTLESYNTADETRFAFRTDCFKSRKEAPLHCSFESKNTRRDTLGTHLSLDAENKCINWSDNVYMKSKPDNQNCGIFETDQTSHHIGSSGEKQLSTVCQDKKKNQSAGALKLETEVQESEQTHVERIQELCKHGKVKAEEMHSNSGKDQNHNSPCCFTSVICHSSTVTRVDEENMATIFPHDPELWTGQTVTGRTYCAIAEHVKAPNDLDNQDLESIPAYEYNICSVDLIKDNGQLDINSSEKDSNKNEQMQEIPKMSTKNTTCDLPVDNVAVALSDEISGTRIQFQDRGICVKRKLKEKNCDNCKSAKNDLARSASETNTDSFYNNEQDAPLENINTTTKLYRSLSMPPEGNTCQPTYTDTQPSYSGQLFYHCDSRTNHISFAPNFSLTLSDTSSEDNDVSTFSSQTATLSKGGLVLLDISSESSEMLVSYKCALEMGTNAATIMDHDESQNNECQMGNNRHIASSNEGANILKTSLKTCISDCAHNSTASTSVSELAPSAFTNTSDLSSTVHHAFRCSLCERSFSQRGSLNRHVRSHLGVRPFPCPQCPMSFSRQYRVMEHMRVHQRCALGTDFLKPSASSF